MVCNEKYIRNILRERPQIMQHTSFFFGRSRSAGAVIEVRDKDLAPEVRK